MVLECWVIPEIFFAGLGLDEVEYARKWRLNKPQVVVWPTEMRIWARQQKRGFRVRKIGGHGLKVLSATMSWDSINVRVYWQSRCSESLRKHNNSRRYHHPNEVSKKKKTRTASNDFGETEKDLDTLDSRKDLDHERFCLPNYSGNLLTIPFSQISSGLGRFKSVLLSTITFWQKTSKSAAKTTIEICCAIICYIL